MKQNEEMKYGLFLTMSDKAYMVTAELREVKNANHENFGKFRIFTDMQYNPLFDVTKDKDFYTFEEAEKILKSLNFIKLRDDFNYYNIEHLREIKNQLSEKWIENYNLWANFTG